MTDSRPWPTDAKIIEIGVQDAALAQCVRHAGFSKYLGVSKDARRIKQLEQRHPDLAAGFAHWDGRKVVLNNNADVLVLSGSWMLATWKFRSVRHAQVVAWRIGINPLSWLALIGCLMHMVTGRYSRPKLVALRGPAGITRRLITCRVRRRKNCYRNSLHFVPHAHGLRGMFEQFDRQQVKYAVLRWFESLPNLKPGEDVDILIDDASLETALKIMHEFPGVQPCDIYSPSGLARSHYRGTPYYPAPVAQAILDGAVRLHDLCFVPQPWDYFHSLAYHAVYQKGLDSHLPLKGAAENQHSKAKHDYSRVLRQQADQLGINAEISLEGLHAYLQKGGWAPPPHMLARLAAACPQSRWLASLAGQLSADMHDQGLAVFVLREEGIRRGFQDQMVEMIRKTGFEIWSVKKLSPAEIRYSAPRTRGGNWGPGPGDYVGGDPAVIVVAYDPHPIAPSWKQRRRFPHRTNARIFAKELIRDAVMAQSADSHGCNALHSSDHAAEAWHLIEVFAPELMSQIHDRLRQIHGLELGQTISMEDARGRKTAKPALSNVPQRRAA
jgi:hypothetical protein